MRFSTISANSLSILLVSLASLATASGQTARSKLDPNEPLEKYDMPPAAYIYRLETSPRMISPLWRFISYQVNVDAQGNNIVGDAANEPSIAVDPTDGNKMTIGWRQFDTFSPTSGRPAGASPPMPASLDISRASWKITCFAATRYWTPMRPEIFSTLACWETFFYDDIWRSTNGGQFLDAFNHLMTGARGDKEWFTIDTDQRHGSRVPVSVLDRFCACDFGRQFSRSTDGGATWMNPIFHSELAVWGTLDVDSNGNLFIGGGRLGSPFWCLRSSNAQNPAVTPTFDQVTQVNLGGSLVFGGTINPGGLAGQMFLAVDRSGGPTNNNIYMVASVNQPASVPART